MDAVLPRVAPEILALFRTTYGALLLGTLAWTLPHAKRFFQSERWGGYGQSCSFVDSIQNPLLLPVVLAVWVAAGICLVAGQWTVAAAGVNLLLCRYFFLQMRWKGVLRGMGAPGYMTCWLAAAVFVLELCQRHAPELLALGLLVFQVDFALIMFVAGWYKFNAGYAEDEGMECGMVNPQWGYWWRAYRQLPPSSWFFRFNNHMAWGGEVVAGLLMLFPATRFWGALFMFASFIYIGLNIRLLLLAPMVMLACVLFCEIGSPGQAALGQIASCAPTGVEGTWRVPVACLPGLRAALWSYLALLPVAYGGMFANFYYRRALPGRVQSFLDRYTNFFGLILWRVFSADVTQFYIRIHRRDGATGERELVSHWNLASGLRYSHVGEAITVTSLFTTLKYYPADNQLFRERLLRYARTVPCPVGSDLIFEYVRISKAGDRFHDESVAEYVVNPTLGTVVEWTLDPSFSVRAPAPKSPVHPGHRPGSYSPARR